MLTAKKIARTRRNTYGLPEMRNADAVRRLPKLRLSGESPSETGTRPETWIRQAIHKTMTDEKHIYTKPATHCWQWVAAL